MWSVSKVSARPELLCIRHRILRTIRTFFDERGFLEVEVPILWREVIPEDHIEPMRSGDRWLLTSPEIHMKRLLAEGHERIYAIGPTFRAGERGPLHHPEFRMLEWYRAGGDWQSGQIARALVELITRALAAEPAPPVLPQDIFLEPPNGEQ